jgi:hypothetical protein
MALSSCSSAALKSGLGHVVGHAEGEVLGRKLRQSSPDRIGDQGALLLLRLRFALETGLLGRLDVDGYREIHVEHHGLDQRCERFAGLSGSVLAAAAHEPLGPGLADDGLDQVVEDDGVAADVPARLQADAGMREADRAHFGHVALVEGAGADRRPVVDLGTLGPRHVRVVLEEALDLGRCAQALVELVEASRQLPIDDPLQLADALAALAVELHELHAGVEIGIGRCCLAHGARSIVAALPVQSSWNC